MSVRIKVEEFVLNASLGGNSLRIHASLLSLVAGIFLVFIATCIFSFIRISDLRGGFFIDSDSLDWVARLLIQLSLPFLIYCAVAILAYRRFATEVAATIAKRDIEIVLDERFRLITERYLRPLTNDESARLEELDEQAKATEIEQADELTITNRGSRAAQLDASLDRLEQYIGTLKSHAR